MPHTPDSPASSPSKNKRIALGLDVLLLVAAVLLFALSFPSFISQWGFFPLAFVALIPVFILVHRSGWIKTLLYGALYGYACYALYNYWLATFHPLTLVIVPPIHAFYLLLLFLLLKAADTFFPKQGYLLQALLWVSYEYLKVQELRFLAYPYGVLGYSQYLFRPLIGIADLTGVWGVSLLVVFPSAFLGQALRDGWRSLLRSVKDRWVPLVAYAAVFIAVIGYGFGSRVDLEDSRRWKVALVQQNVDPWRGGTRAYEKSLNVLTRLSTEAARSDPEIIIWSETSFVPAIDWHTRYRQNRSSYALVKRLREYLSAQDQPFLIGNDDGQLRKNEFGQEVRVDYNATILWDGAEIIDTYRKLHLVPFTESFPFERLLPGIYTWLKNADTHFWEKGEEYTVFENNGVKFSTPICFEDTFGYICRDFVRAGAEVLVNMTNDSWSQAVACEMQHMIMGLFRAVENRRTLVRATNGGITCVVDPNGRIVEWLEPFTEATLIADVPVFTGRGTLYTRWGDWFAVILLAASVLWLTVGLIRHLVSRRSSQSSRND